MNDITLEIRNLNKSYGTKKALCNFSAKLTCGIYGLLGPNGAGKSTLMNIITDNLAADSGKILLDGVAVSKLGKEYRKILGFMPQQQGLYDNFTVRRFLYYIAALKGMGRREARNQVDEVLGMVNLREDADRVVSDTEPKGYKYRVVRPVLEDAYLYMTKSSAEHVHITGHVKRNGVN
jgi:ABC-2 type transport system ATP-binding protein